LPTLYILARFQSPAPPDRNDSSSPSLRTRGTGPAFEIENFGLGAETEPQQEIRRQQRDVVAGSTIDLDEVTTPEILDPCRVKRLHSGHVPGMFYRALAGLVNRSCPPSHACCSFASVRWGSRRPAPHGEGPFFSLPLLIGRGLRLVIDERVEDPQPRQRQEIVESVDHAPKET
jgi:hypothetical protein